MGHYVSNKYSLQAMKKCNIQKSVSWCEKLKIPCNKFSEKTNIFLPIINDHKVLEEGVEEDVEDVAEES